MSFLFEIVKYNKYTMEQQRETRLFVKKYNKILKNACKSDYATIYY